ncbi:D-amino-acid oxidase [Mycena sanguinolenta]|uniref:D-amino-acid oxidase n=1 Tax=Mycena sanguinolenta TaxID=230812 RepID=A0A8H6Z981_9AGAR|nr:D-amino-acid oxidase [Mycena sanguinolenta]
MSQTKKQITVIGAGVIGLTTAIHLQEKEEYQVTIVAEIWPSDHPTAHYTSHWAGGHHRTADGEDKRQRAMDERTYQVFRLMSEPGHAAEKCFIRTPQYEHYFEELGHPPGVENMPDFRYMEKSELLPGAVVGISFTAISFDAPLYLDYLQKRFLDAGGKLVHGSVQHIKQVVEGGSAVFEGRLPEPPAAVVVCAGLGARTLGGVEDKTVTPVRGQTVILHAPWVRFGATRRKIEDEMISYVIPRPGGNIVVGGTMSADDWYPAPREKTKTAILEKALALWPEIVPPHARRDRDPTVADLYPIIVEEGAGLRPQRDDGIRIEAEWVEANGVKAPVVFHYGHGSSGFESSWGSAYMAVDLMEKVMDANRSR